MKYQTSTKIVITNICLSGMRKNCENKQTDRNQKIFEFIINPKAETITTKIIIDFESL